MTKLLKCWNTNKRRILITIGVILFIFICIRIANEMVRQQNIARMQQYQNKKTEAKDVTKSNETVISKVKIDETRAEQNETVIKQFIQYCNEKQIQQAYQLLSKECKNEIFQNEQIFLNQYFNRIFATPKGYQLQLWNKNNQYDTYKVTYHEGNPLQTGGISNESIVEYITVLKEEQGVKLNINNFIAKEEIHKSKENNHVTVSVESKSIYDNYEIYHLKIQNDTNQTILFHDGKNSHHICLLDENNVEYVSFMNEIPTTDLIIKSPYEKTIDIKFNKLYSAERKIQKIKFENIILDYEKYKQNPNDETISTIEIIINL